MSPAFLDSIGYSSFSFLFFPRESYISLSPSVCRVPLMLEDGAVRYAVFQSAGRASRAPLLFCQVERVLLQVNYTVVSHDEFGVLQRHIWRFL